MQFHLAPMEGITGYIYRKAFAECFGGVDKYVSPFIVPHRNRGFKTKELKDIFPENNKEICLVPQLLTNDAGDFCRAAEEFRVMGYEEVNLNLGCPSGTVTAKGKGAGFLAFPEELEAFLDAIFANTKVEISIKTRIGVSEYEEFYRILDIYKKYPIKELTIHPRLLKDYYKNTPNVEMFAYAAENYSGRIIYNGDIFSKEDYKKLISSVPDFAGIMLGRGLLTNPGLIREIKGEKSLQKSEMKIFHDRILSGYEEIIDGDRNVLFRMKELWFYMIQLFGNHEKYAKQIKKSQTIREYKQIVESIFINLSLQIEEVKL
ncbi:MAG: tRNA-dihydrouridine synthase family protein [Lachnospiraceae bacterium]|nr:tRNA-dihydrouridine synthase family protein [Lachnospiraceae bacterium]